MLDQPSRARASAAGKPSSRRRRQLTGRPSAAFRFACVVRIIAFMKKYPLLFAGALALGATLLCPSALGAEKRPTVGFLVIGTNNVYFMSCYHGAQKAAAELGVDLILGGPAEPDPARQDAIVDEWIARGVDAIAAACDDKDRLSAALRRAESRGIKVITYDADAQTDARAFFVNQATAESIGTALMDDAARL